MDDTNTRKKFSPEHRVSNDDIIEFMGSNQRTLAKLPPEMSADLISDTYLRLQLDAIHEYLHGLSMKNPRLAEESTALSLCSYESPPTDLPSDRNTFKQEVIAQTLQIQTCLREDSSHLSIRAGTCSMIDLSHRLYSLDMYEEAASMGAWALNLCRTIAKTTSPLYLPHFVRGLQQLSYIYISIEDDDNAKATIQETLSICRRLYASVATQEVSLKLEALTTLAYVSDLKDDFKASLESAREGVCMYEKVVIKSYVPTSDTSADGCHSAWNKEIQCRIMKTLPDKVISDYSKALQQLSFSLQATNQLEDAVQAGLKALDILLNSRLFFSDLVQTDIAALFYRLSHRQFHLIVKLDQALMYAEQAIDIYRALYEKNEQKYIVSLFHGLYEKANSLGKLQRYDQALIIWKEMSVLAMNMKDGQVFRADALNGLASCYHGLNQHDEAAIIRTESITIYQTALNSSSDKAAHAYYNLGIDLHFAGRFPEAIEALQTALKIFHFLVFDNPHRFTQNIAESLTQLSLNLIYSNRHEEAFDDGYESLKLHSSMIDEDSCVVPEYAIALRVNFLAAETSEDESKSLERAHYSLYCARHLFIRFPDQCSMLFIEAILSQADVFYRFDFLLKASTVIQEALNWFDQSPSTAVSKANAEHYMLCLIAYSKLVHHQGFMRERIKLLEKSITIGELYSSDPRIVRLLIESMRCRAETLGWISLHSEAVEASLQCEKLARQHTLDNVVGLVSCLRVCCGAFRDIGEPAKALTYIEEALRLCHTNELNMAAKAGPSAYLFESECLHNLSECLAEMGQEENALFYAQSSLDSVSKLRNRYPTLPWSEIEPSHIAALHTLAMRLAAKGDSLHALEMIVAVRSYYENLAKNTGRVSISLAHALYEEGVLYCSAGRHEEGVVARTKLQDLQNQLDTTLPDFAEQTRLHLAKVKARSSMSNLLAKFDLCCGHQQEMPQA